MYCFGALEQKIQPTPVNNSTSHDVGVVTVFQELILTENSIFWTALLLLNDFDPCPVLYIVEQKLLTVSLSRRRLLTSAPKIHLPSAGVNY